MHTFTHTLTGIDLEAESSGQVVPTPGHVVPAIVVIVNEYIGTLDLLTYI